MSKTAYRKTPCNIQFTHPNGEIVHLNHYEDFFSPTTWSGFKRIALKDLTNGMIIDLLKSLYSSRNETYQNRYLFENSRFGESRYSEEEFKKKHEFINSVFPESMMYLSMNAHSQYTNTRPASLHHESAKEYFKETYLKAMEMEKTIQKIVELPFSLQYFIKLPPTIYILISTISQLLTQNMCYLVSDDDESLKFKEAAKFITDEKGYLTITSSFLQNTFKLRVSITKNNRESLYRIFSYNQDVCKTLGGFWPIKTPKESITNRLYGVELECSTKYSIKEIIDSQDNLFMIGKRDGSITGQYDLNIELVTVPMTLKAHKTEWAKWFSDLEYAGFDTTKETNNGMHIHIDRNAFYSQHHTRNFTWFFSNPANRAFLTLFSERASNNILMYCPFPIIPRGLRKNSVFRNIGSYNLGRGVINFGKKNTIEVRLFKGIVSLAEIVKNLEFVDSLIEFTSLEKTMSTLTLTEYMKFLKECPENKYHILKEYIFKKIPKLSTIVEDSIVAEIVFTEHRPSFITRLINNSKLKKDGFELANILNRTVAKRKRVYSFDKETGQVISDAGTYGSKLAPLDILVAERFSSNKNTKNTTTVYTR